MGFPKVLDSGVRRRSKAEREPTLDLLFLQDPEPKRSRVQMIQKRIQIWAVLHGKEVLIS